MPMYTVCAGDTIASIAHENGFLTATIWDHGENAALKAKRKNPNLLFPGDEVFIPEKELKQETGGANAKHSFKVKGEPNKLKLRLMKMGKPRANEAYTLDIDGKLIKGNTDGNGIIEQVIPRNAKGGTLLLQGGKEKYPVKIGNLDPVEEIAGVRQRLNNLGFNCGSESNEIDEDLRAALRKFQERQKLEITGEPDGATKAALQKMHG